MHFSKYFDQKLKFFICLDFIPFFSPKRVYNEEDMSFDQKMDFSWHITILGHFLNSATLGNFSIFSEIFFCMSKVDIHTNLYEYSLKIECFTD